MLEFWFDPTQSRQRKLIWLIALIVVTAVLYCVMPLSLQAILMFIATGLVFLICRYAQQQLKNQHLLRLLKWIPIALFIALVFLHAQRALLILGAQGLGFMALSISVFSLQLLFQSKSKP